ncbi:MAG TPA: hypothetical protein VGX16_06575, partial [Solirubrobacteraceae bacterium]|nr:hypothetical protein [Solirubrobacteraceae bacterium]
MPITLVTGPANAGKAEVVLGELRARAARGERPILVVPTRADVERYGRELQGLQEPEGPPGSEGPAEREIRVERFEGLLAEVLRRAGSTGREPAPLVRERLLATLAARLHARP